MDYTKEWSCELSSSLPILVFLLGSGFCFESNAHYRFIMFFFQTAVYLTPLFNEEKLHLAAWP